MSIPSLVVLDVDDWQALYADGKIIYEGHSIDWPWVLRVLLNLDVEQHSVMKWFAEADLMEFPKWLPEYEED